MSGVYYNEIDKFAAQWLRELIKAGQIAPGEVDERSIEDVLPSEIKEFTQCHFFAGIGVWSYALRRAGWADDRRVWTGSCPCQPFSAAGKGVGFDDERHLWPAFHHLIEQCRPERVFGEQVASKDADPWIDLVHTDMEALGYAFGAVPFPSASIGAPHIRDRLYWVAHSQQHHRGRQTQTAHHGQPQADRPADWTGGCGGAFGRMGDASNTGLAQRIGHTRVLGGTIGASQGKTTERAGVHIGGVADNDSNGRQPGREGCEAMGYGQAIRADCGAGGLADNQGGGRREECQDTRGGADGDRAQGMPSGLVDGGSNSRPGPTNGFWRDADWLGCRDEKWRPVEPGTFPLVAGAPARVGRLRGYGNAINAQAAQIFVECYLDTFDK